MSELDRGTNFYKDAVIDDLMDTCLNNLRFMREHLEWAYRDQTDTFWKQEYQDLGLENSRWAKLTAPLGQD